MSEYSNNLAQTVQPGQSVIFTDAPVPCTRGFVRHRDDTGSFLLSGYVPNTPGCNCCKPKSAQYLVSFGANIAVPTGQNPGEVSLAITIDGSQIPSSLMIQTPAAVAEFSNVSRTINVEVWKGCCSTITVTNTSDIPITVQNANIIITRPDLLVSR